ncbi:MAG: hypothetical protein NTY68_03640 [Candidatus Micrarchaeota archaeon]|nr:hypothetical protein [Candidatus Micrarchaeota archaeon]
MESIDRHIEEYGSIEGFVNPQLVSSVIEPGKSVASEILENAKQGSVRDIFFSRMYIEFINRMNMEFRKSDWYALELSENPNEGICPYGPCENISAIEVNGNEKIKINGEKSEMPNPFPELGNDITVEIRQDPLEQSLYKANFVSFFNISILDICSVKSGMKKMGWKVKKVELPENPLFALAQIMKNKRIGAIEKEGIFYPNPSLMWNEEFSYKVFEGSKMPEKMRSLERYNCLKDASSFIRNFSLMNGKGIEYGKARINKFNLISREVALGEEVSKKVLGSMKKDFDYKVENGVVLAKLGTLISALSSKFDEERITLRYSDVSAKAKKKQAPREAILDSDIFLLGDIDISFAREGNSIAVNASLSRMTENDYFLNIIHNYRIEKIGERIVMMVE